VRVPQYASTGPSAVVHGFNRSMAVAVSRPEQAARGRSPKAIRQTKTRKL
jgi:hypothetical protein